MHHGIWLLRLIVEMEGKIFLHRCSVFPPSLRLYRNCLLFHQKTYLRHRTQLDIFGPRGDQELPRSIADSEFQKGVFAEKMGAYPQFLSLILRQERQNYQWK